MKLIKIGLKLSDDSVYRHNVFLMRQWANYQIVDLYQQRHNE